jgi:hypothetical protein
MSNRLRLAARAGRCPSRVSEVPNAANGDNGAGVMQVVNAVNPELRSLKADRMRVSGNSINFLRFGDASATAQREDLL